MFFFDATFLILIPALLLALYAHTKVTQTYAVLSRKRARVGLSGWQVAKDFVEQLGLRVRIEEIPGALTDHYDPSREVLRLSQAVARGTSIADLAIVAHEVGHVLQKREGYAPFALRSTLVPVAGFGSQLALPLFFLGFLFAFRPLMDIGILLFSFAVLFQLVVLPVEFDASRRALHVLERLGLVSNEERPLVQQMLRAASLTYVAATAVAALQLIRLFLLRESRE
ncbi:MAG: zinc metallopeptidase [Atribacterota bacterium]